jgi:D-sedoheptulose 7-phosphate isomerase
MTACGNDLLYDQIFERQIDPLGNPGDVALGISTGGNSPNVVKGLTEAGKKGLTAILMTGPRVARAAGFSDIVVAVPWLELGSCARAARRFLSRDLRAD